MNKLLLSFLAAFLPMSGFSQLTNSDFESWGTESNTWGVPPFIATETFNYNDPTEWTTSNHLVGHSALGAASNVLQEDTNTHGGMHAIRLETIYREVATPAGSLPFMIPGFTANGNFIIDIAGAATGAPVDPLLIPGAGQPVSTRYSNLQGYYDYYPKVDTNTGLIDTAYFLVYMLDAERAVVGAGAFFAFDSTSGYTAFDIPIYYQACSMPDTCLVYISSSPLSSGFIAGVAGSVLFVDDISLVAGSVNVIPQAYDDSVGTDEDVAVIIDVQDNDNDCEPGPLVTASITIPPANGSTIINADNTVTYTPDLGFIGLDSFQYSLCDTGFACDLADVSVTVSNVVGVGITVVQNHEIKIETNLVQKSIRVISNQTDLNIELYDLTGNLLIGSSNKSISIEHLAPALYILQISDSQGNRLKTERIVKY